MKRSEKLAVIYKSPKGRVVAYDGCGRRILFEEPGARADWEWAVYQGQRRSIDRESNWVDEI